MSWKYFNEKEFSCKCCGKILLDKELVKRLEVAREIAGIPFVIASGYRCEKHNKEVGGRPESAHLSGKAADVVCTDSKSRFLIVTSLIKAGFQRIGISDTFVHADIDLNKPHPVIWLY